jgi:hypothetical protein
MIAPHQVHGNAYLKELLTNRDTFKQQVQHLQETIFMSSIYDVLFGLQRFPATDIFT